MPDARIVEIRNLLPQALLHDWVRLGSRLVRLLRDQHHPDAHEAILSRLLAQARASVTLREQRRLNVPRVSFPETLPITARKDEIVAAIRNNQVVVVAGETGSGKTTQLPKMCLEAGLGIEAKIGCTQPRRIAALSISRRIAEELNVAWGREVGCKIRFDDRSSPQTYIKLMTDGILLAETQGDPLLSEYNGIIVDEAHERSLNIDFLLGYLKGLLAKRPELKLIITSATIDTEVFSRAFNKAPIIEVSGRVYPVEVVYTPFDTISEERGEMTYIDATVRAADRVLCEPGFGDVLIFMPSERDIRETTDLLKGRFGNETEIIPLFGRLSAGEQQRVFSPSTRRKLVISTNIAETSLTIPGIRYVIDTGLARISRYNPRTRTKRLPIEPIAQSSANQRKGRSGRVQNGVCIRLYSEEDFCARPRFTQPEIQRANLAEVILHMMAFRLGEIESFPFINPPTAAAIQGGYKLLQELGALDASRRLTSLGRDLARLPIDPTLGRMLLQAQHEHATRELLIIAAGLSIQDPRERPFEQKDAATAAHKRFADPRSDFLTLLNIWNAVHDEWEKLRTQNQRRKFCKANFLSYVRMREWQDLYSQLHDALEELGTLKLNESNAAYEAVHRSILAGLLGHIAQREERNSYKGAGNRKLMLFPGSSLFDRAEKSRKSKSKHGEDEAAGETAKTHQPDWIIAGEMLETSQLFARTVAGIDPLWLVALASHLCKVAHANPRWDAAAGRVLVDERLTLYGLEIHQRKAAYGNVDSKAATEIFIRSALIEEGLFPESEKMGSGATVPSSQPNQVRGRTSRAPMLRRGVAHHTGMPKSSGSGPALPPAYHFLEYNRQIRQKIEIWQTRARRHDLVDLDQALFDFYAKRIETVSSLDELNRFLRGLSDPAYLCVAEADLIGDEQLSFDAEAFPNTVAVEGHPVELSYSYSPGEDQDGVTLKLHPHLAQILSPAAVEWAVPGLREAQLAELLRTLPKSIRKQLMPLPPKIAEIVRHLRPDGPSLKHALCSFIRQRYGVELNPSAWPAGVLPNHLQPRIEIVLGDKTLLAGRDLSQLRAQLEKVRIAAAAEPAEWTDLAQKWEQFGLTSWTFGDLPDRVSVEKEGNMPLQAWPGLQVEDGQVNLRLFRSQRAARSATLPGIQRLVEVAIQKDLGWLQKDLRVLSRFEPLCQGFCSMEDLQSAAFENLQRHLLPAELFQALKQAHFDAAVKQARERLPGLAIKLIDRLEPILQLRAEILRRFGGRPPPTAVKSRTVSDLKELVAPHPKASSQSGVAEQELQALLPKNFLQTISFERLPHMTRYLKALMTRVERAALNPLKDRERARQLAPYVQVLRELEAASDRQQLEEFRWLIEEFKVSLFAQELGTAVPVSAKRLDQYVERLRLASTP